MEAAVVGATEVAVMATAVAMWVATAREVVVMAVVK